MTELERFEPRFATAYRRYLDEAPTEVDAAAVVHAIVAAYPRRRHRGWSIGWTVVPRRRLAVLVLVVAVLTALLGGLLYVGSRHGPAGWQRLDVPGGGSFRDVVKIATGFLAVGSTETGAGVWTSQDCVHWAAVPTGDAFRGGIVSAVATGGPGLVAVGQVGASISGQAGAVWTSPDGRAWSRAPENPSFDSVQIVDILESSGLLVAVGGGAPMGTGNSPAIWTSGDGVRWDRVARLEPSAPGLFGAISSVVAGGPGLVAVGVVDTGAPVWTSRDGLTWQRAPAGDWGRFAGMREVAEGAGGRLVAVGDGGGTTPGPMIWGSNDGMSWTAAADGASFMATSSDLGWSGPVSVVATDRGFLAVGYEYLQHYPGSDVPMELPQQGVVWTSADGRSWTRLADDVVLAYAQLDRVMACGDTLLASGIDAHDTQAWEWPSAVWALEGGM